MFSVGGTNMSSSAINRIDSKDKQGFTMDQISQFGQSLDLDFILNLDGGGSTESFVNGLGSTLITTEKPWDHEGHGYQRLIQNAIMLVPKLKTNQIKAYNGIGNLGYIEMDNRLLSAYRYHEHFPGNYRYMMGNVEHTSDPDKDDNYFFSDRPPVRLISLSPSLAKIKHYNETDNSYTLKSGGIFSSRFKVDGENGEGAVLFSMSEDGTYVRKWSSTKNKEYLSRDYRDYTIIGIGKIPSRLLERLRIADRPITLKGETDFKKNSSSDAVGINPSEYKLGGTSIKDETYLSDAFQKHIALYAFTIKNYQVENIFIKANSNDDHYYKTYIDDKWHNVTWVAKGGTSALNMIIVDDNVLLEDGKNGGVNQMTKFNFYDLPSATHMMLGAVNVDGSYVTGEKTRLSLDNTLFVVGNQKVEAVISELKTKYQSGNSTKALKKLNVQPFPKLDELSGVPNGDGYLLTYEEKEGLHSFAASGNGTPIFYGLNLNGTTRRAYKDMPEPGPEVKTVKHIPWKPIALTTFSGGAEGWWIGDLIQRSGLKLPLGCSRYPKTIFGLTGASFAGYSAVNSFVPLESTAGGK